MQVDLTEVIELASNMRGLAASLQAFQKIKSHTQIMHPESSVEIGKEVERVCMENLQLALDIVGGV